MAILSNVSFIASIVKLYCSTPAATKNEEKVFRSNILMSTWFLDIFINFEWPTGHLCRQKRSRLLRLNGSSRPLCNREQLVDVFDLSVHQAIQPTFIVNFFFWCHKWPQIHSTLKFSTYISLPTKMFSDRMKRNGRKKTHASISLLFLNILCWRGDKRGDKNWQFFGIQKDINMIDR